MAAKGKKIAITGGSGYLAGCLIPFLIDDKSIDEVRIVDITKPSIEHKKIKFVEQSILDYEGLVKSFKGVDCVVHMAFNINGLHNKKLLEELNVTGSLNVMNAIKDAKVKQLVFTSSIAAYGAHKDNPVPLKEDHPLRGKGTFFYADQKHRLEEKLDIYEKENPGITVSRIRLCTSTGPKASNETVTLYKAPVFVAFPFNQPKVQLVHEEDAGRAFYLAVVKKAKGAFNIGADWDYTAKEHAKIAGTKIIIYLPVWVGKLFANLMWTLRLIKFDPSWIKASLHPVVVDPSKAKEVLGWEPEYDSKQIVKSIL